MMLNHTIWYNKHLMCNTNMLRMQKSVTGPILIQSVETGVRQDKQQTEVSQMKVLKTIRKKTKKRWR